MVTCGALNAELTIAAAICLRTPLMGMRCSRVAGSKSTSRAAMTGGADAPVPPAAASTSARVMVPLGPLPSTACRSTPRSRASLRTGGLASTCTCAAPATSAACAPTPAADTRAGGGSSAAVPFRGRRVSLPLLGPLPTRTSIFSSLSAFGAGEPMSPGSCGTCGTMSAAAATFVCGAPAAPDGGVPAGAPDGSTSKVMSGEPTSTVSPSPWCSAETTPAYGEGISTAALAVSTSTIGWLSFTSSPGWTNHLRISPSVRPSPRSGSLKSRNVGMPVLVGERAVDGVEDAVEIGEVVLFDPRRRVRRREAAHAQHRCLELVEALLRDTRRDLRGQRCEDRRLRDDDRVLGLANARDDRVPVDRGQRPQVDDLEVATFSRSSVGRLQARPHRRTVGEQRHLGTGPSDGRTPQVTGRGGRRVDIGLVPVATLGLEEHDRVVAGDGLLDHPVGINRVGAGDDLQPGGVREVGLRRLAVVLDSADAAAVRDADRDRQLHVPGRPVVHLCDLADDLVERREDEAVELDLAHRTEAADRQADRRADDAGLCERSVDDAVLAEVFLQPVGDAEDAAEPADVLAHDEDLRVVLQCLTQPLVEGLAQGQCRHQCPAPASASSKDAR